MNENKFFNGWPDDLSENLDLLDQLGGPEAYNHYPTGWAMAFSTPFRMYKRYSYQGGICDPMVIHWPKGIKAKGEVRNQYHHVIDIVPTILECIGMEFPQFVQGYEQTPLPGVSMRYSFDAEPDAPTTKVTQYYAMLGTRGIWHEGWKAVAVHGPTSGIGNFDKDVWQLFHTDEDRAEAHDLADQHPDKVEELVRVWFAEAGKYDVLPLDDRLPMEIFMDERRRPSTPRGPTSSTRARPTSRSTPPRTSRPIVQHPRHRRAPRGGRGRAPGPRRALRRPQPVPQGREALVREQLPRHPSRAGAHVPGRRRRRRPRASAHFEKESVGDRKEAIGTARLEIDGKTVAEGPWRTQPGHFALLRRGPVHRSRQRRPGEQGVPLRVPVHRRHDQAGGDLAGDDQHIDLEAEAQAMLARE